MTAPHHTLRTSKFWPWMAGLAAAPCLALSAGMVYFNGVVVFMAFNDPPQYGTSVEQLWAGTGLIVFLILLLASLAMLASLFIPSVRLWRWALLGLTGALIGLPVFSIVGITYILGEERKGGDWAGLGVMIGFVFGIFVPIIAGILCAAMLIAWRQIGRGR